MSRLFVLLSCVTAGALASISTPAEADGPVDRTFQVIRVFPQTDTHLALLEDWYERETELELDFWKAPSRVFGAVDVMVSDAWVRRALERLRVPHNVTIDSVAALIETRDAEHRVRQRHSRRRRQTDDFDFSMYNKYDEMLAYMRRLASSLGIARLTGIGGRTTDGNQLQMLRLGTNAGSARKRAVWIDGGIHAREWAAPHTALYVVKMLVDGYRRADPQVLNYLRYLDFYVVPVVNPDGYVYSTTSKNPNVRLWRKNRRRLPGSRCTGVDLNRNFGHSFGGKGSSRVTCSEVYRGTSAFSEVESAAVRDAVQGYELRGRVDAFITLHTYSQMWLHPFGDEYRKYPANHQQLYDVSLKATQALKQEHGTRYIVGSGADVLYPAAGGSDDWAKGVANVKFVYLLELRPNDRVWDGFMLPEDELLPTGEETWAGLKVVLDEVLRNNSLPVVQGSQRG